MDQQFRAHGGRRDADVSRHRGLSSACRLGSGRMATVSSSPTSSAPGSFPGISATRTAWLWRGGRLCWPMIRPGIPACPRRVRSACRKVRSLNLPSNQDPTSSFRGPVVGRGQSEPKPAIFVPFADAGSTGGIFRVWLRAPGVRSAEQDLAPGRRRGESFASGQSARLDHRRRPIQLCRDLQWTTRQGRLVRRDARAARRRQTGCFHAWPEF